MRRAKIVCTLGPATSSAERLSELVAAGMDVARLNLSHGAYEDHEKVYLEVRRASDESGRAVGVLVDLQGPKIRTGRFADGPVTLENGDRFTITVEDVLGDQDRVSTTYKGLPGDVTVGDRLLIDDRSEEHTSELQSRSDLVCRLLLEKKKKTKTTIFTYDNNKKTTTKTTK